MIPCLYDNFKKWASTGSIYIISDTHFDDPDCKIMDPNWIAPEEHLSKLRQFITGNDAVIHLGDIGNPEWLTLLHAKTKILIMGNHESGKSNYVPYFNAIYDGPLMIADRIILSHEPIPKLNWALNIHGHLHRNSDLISDGYHLCASSNLINFGAFNLGALIKNGILSKIDSLHRITINKAAGR